MSDSNYKSGYSYGYQNQNAEKATEQQIPDPVARDSFNKGMSDAQN